MNQINEKPLELDDVTDEMTASLSMFKFMATALCYINEVKPARTLNEQESFGMQQLFDCIEKRFEKVNDCLNENLEPLLAEAHKAQNPKKDGLNPPCSKAIAGQGGRKEMS